MENFVVSARKYRPATFASVVGQSHITSTLRNAIGRGQLAHAYLFCGPRGVGKTTCARIFAKAINCLSPVDNEACNECESCRSFNEGRSFNIHELDAASNNSVDDIRSLTEQVRIPPQIGRYSVYIIDEVHMLSSAAFNAFLKTLEEPPAHAIFILATTEKHKILPTILSRCQIFDFNRIRVEDSVGYLKLIAGKEGITYDDESLHLIAQKADGGMRDALSMFDKAVSFCGSNLNFKEVAQTLNVLDYDTYFNVTSLLLQGNYPAALTLFDEVLRKGFSGQTFIAGLNNHLRDMLMCKNPQTQALLEVTGSLLERYKAQSVECDVGFLFSAIALLTELDGTLRTATNQRLNVELGLMKLCSLGQKKNEPFGAIIPATLPPLDIPVSTVPTGSASAPVSSPTATPVATPAATASPAPEPAKVSAPNAPKAPITATGSSQHHSAGEVTRENRPSGTAAAPDDGSPRQSRAYIHTLPHTISGSPIASILNATPCSTYEATPEIVEETAQPVVETTAIDPESESKIISHKDRFIRNLGSERPRIAMAFHEMRVTGNHITLTVPTEALYEEIMRNRTEILTLLTELADIRGALDLEVIVREESGARKPIRVEDKLRYLTEQNPTLSFLRQKLDMEIE